MWIIFLLWHCGAGSATHVSSPHRKNEPLIWDNWLKKSHLGTVKLKELVAQAWIYSRTSEGTAIHHPVQDHTVWARYWLKFKTGNGEQSRLHPGISLNRTKVLWNRERGLVLVWACERFNIYVYGRNFQLESDHKPHECMFGRLSKPSARIER